ncbi:MAG: hypothetical protein LBF88_12575 [Planctomycetaceae bacterium]|nr:hypothetical protein [Planctomycetaceae bacterium]
MYGQNSNRIRNRKADGVSPKCCAGWVGNLNCYAVGFEFPPVNKGKSASTPMRSNHLETIDGTTISGCR